MPTNKPKIILILDQGMRDRIDDYRYANRIPSRSEAIRRLILEALQNYEKMKSEQS